MKCDELKEYKAYEYGTSYVYDIGEVKEAIAELKQKLEDVQASAYAESVDAGAENWMLRRELWLARTRTARYAKMFWEKNVILNELFYFTIDYRCYEKGMKEQTLRPSKWAKVWRNVERKCLEKAEEYK